MKLTQKRIQNRATTLFFSVLTSFASLMMVMSVQQNNVSAATCGKADTAIVACPQRDSGSVEDTGVWGILLIVLRILTAGVGIVAVGGIAYGAVLYASAGEKSDQVRKGMGVIQNVIIGLVLYAATYAFLEFIIPGGVLG